MEEIAKGNCPESEEMVRYFGNVDKLAKKEAFRMLRELTSKMKVPSHNFEKAQWLSKNLATENSDHPNFEKAMSLVNLILEIGWS